MKKREESDLQGLGLASGQDWHAAWAWVLGSLVLATGAVAWALPIVDGDLWWQMAYGRDMLANGTLIPDHTIYSWAPIDNLEDHVYCAWISEILFYWLYSLGGLRPLFVLRYLFLLIILLIPWMAAWRNGLGHHPLTYLILLFALLSMHTKGYIKPNLFSIVFMTATVGTYFAIRDAGKQGWRLCYIFPAIMALWVNSHGAWVFGAAFLTFVGIGELINLWISRSVALPWRVLKHLLIALGLTLVATLLTPYHMHYHLHLLEAMTAQGATSELRAIREHLPISARSLRHLHYVEYLGGSVAILLALFFSRKRKSINWAILLPNAFFIYMYWFMIRTTSFFGPIFALTAIHWLASGYSRLQIPPRRWRLAFGGLCTVVILSVGGEQAYDRAVSPTAKVWLGFGASYSSPVQEAAFIEEHMPEARIGNDYVSGGYLLWKFAPERKIFIDPRHFPYRSWFHEYQNMSAARPGIRGFLLKHQADVWCILHRKHSAVKWFIRSKNWKAVYCGDAAVLFVRRDGPYGDMPLRHSNGLAVIRNPVMAHYAMGHAVMVGDLTAAQKAHESLSRLTYTEAAKDVYRHDSLELMRLMWRTQRWYDALAIGDQALEVYPEDLELLYRTGTMAYDIANLIPDAPSEVSSKWRRYLQTFVALAEEDPKRDLTQLEKARDLLREGDKESEVDDEG